MSLLRGPIGLIIQRMADELAPDIQADYIDCRLDEIMPLIEIELQAARVETLTKVRLMIFDQYGTGVTSLIKKIDKLIEAEK